MRSCNSCGEKSSAPAGSDAGALDSFLRLEASESQQLEQQPAGSMLTVYAALKALALYALPAILALGVLYALWDR